MTKITIGTMVKNEDDIVAEWIEYYGELFGYENLYIIDNYSDDLTYEICEKYLERGIHLFREHNYKDKGNFMTYFKNTTGCDIFIPVDIDEFICYYDKDSKSVTKNGIVEYLNSLFNSGNGVFKMNYLGPMKTNDAPGLKKFTHATYVDYKNVAKTFIIPKYVNSTFTFDHGNHCNIDNWILSNLVLIHYHERSHEQVHKKIWANVTGFGYSTDLESLRQLKQSGSNGVHRVEMLINILENPVCNLDPHKHSEIQGDWIDIRNIL